MTEVTRVRPVTVRWRLMSLSVLNEHRDDHPEGEWEDYMWAPVRVCAAVEDRFGQRALGDLLTAMGTRFHLRGDWGNLEVRPYVSAAVRPYGSGRRYALVG